jgi:hypothetical protein
MAAKKSTDGTGKRKAATTRPSKPSTAKAPTKKGTAGEAVAQSTSAPSTFEFNVAGQTYSVSGLLTDPRIDIESRSSLPLIVAIDVKKLTPAELDALDAYLRSLDAQSAIHMIGLGASHNK